MIVGRGLYPKFVRNTKAAKVLSIGISHTERTTHLYALAMIPGFPTFELAEHKRPIYITHELIFAPLIDARRRI